MPPLQTTSLAFALSAIGLWLMLPPRGLRLRMAGGVLSAAGLGLFASLAPRIGTWAADGVFWILAGVALFAAAATVTSRNPVYSALWFAVSLLGTAGLFMFDGAQFLGVATIVVYAGAIVVTFLFVLMLAQPDGHAFYDRISWGKAPSLLSAVAGALIVGVLSMTLASVWRHDAQAAPASDQLAERVLHEEHVARLGGELFTRHLVAVEVAGTLLLVALVGAVAIVAHGKANRVAGAERSEAPAGDSLRSAPATRQLEKTRHG